MLRQLKLLGMAALAIAAVTAISASAASAADFHASSESTWLKGEQTTQNVFTVNGGNVKCTGAVFTTEEIAAATVLGEVTKEEEEEGKTAGTTVIPAYSGCTAFGQAATVSMNGCHYRLTASTATLGSVHIECNTGGEIVVKANTAGCTVKVKAQTPTTPTLDYKKVETGSIKEVEITSTVAGIHYTSSGGICGASGTNGTYTGSVLTKGYSTSTFTGQKSIWVE